MDKKTLIGCFLAAAIIILASFTSVIGSNDNESKRKIVVSPLYMYRMDEKLNRPFTEIKYTGYIGKNIIQNLFPVHGKIVKKIFEDISKTIIEKPGVFYKIIDEMFNNPKIAKMLEASNYEKADFKNYMGKIRLNPSILNQEVDKAAVYIGSSTPVYKVKPLGLSTSNPIGCFVVAIAMVFVALILGVMIGTMTIVTCLSEGCLESVIESIYQGIIQDLEPI